MPPAIAAVVFTLGIFGLFRLDRTEVRTSLALWIPVIWMTLAASRPLSVWLNLAPPPETDIYLEGSPIDRAVFIALLAIGIVVLVYRRVQLPAFMRHNLALLAFFAYCALSILWSDYPGIAFKRWIKAIGDIVMILIVLTDSELGTALKRLLTRLGFVLVPVSVLFVKYYPDLGRGYDRWTWLPVWTGIATNKNELGMICMVFGFASLWRILELLRGDKRDRRTGSFLAHTTILVMAIWLLSKANCMTALSCFALGSTLLLLITVCGLAQRHIHLVVAAVLGFAMFALFFDPGGSLVKELGRNPTLTGRTMLWEVLPQFTPSSLLGAGYQSFWLGDRLQKIRALFPGNPLMEAHNGYLELFLNSGWLGVVLFSCLLISGYRRIISGFRHDATAANVRLTYFVAALIYNCTEAAFKELNLMWITFLLAIIVVPNAELAPETHELEVETEPVARNEWRVESVACVAMRKRVWCR